MPHRDRPIGVDDRSEVMFRENVIGVHADSSGVYLVVPKPIVMVGTRGGRITGIRRNGEREYGGVTRIRLPVGRVEDVTQDLVMSVFRNWVMSLPVSDSQLRGMLSRRLTITRMDAEGNPVGDLPIGKEKVGIRETQVRQRYKPQPGKPRQKYGLHASGKGTSSSQVYEALLETGFRWDMAFPMEGGRVGRLVQRSDGYVVQAVSEPASPEALAMLDQVGMSGVAKGVLISAFMEGVSQDDIDRSGGAHMFFPDRGLDRGVLEGAVIRVGGKAPSGAKGRWGARIPVRDKSAKRKFFMVYPTWMRRAIDSRSESQDRQLNCEHVTNAVRRKVMAANAGPETLLVLLVAHGMDVGSPEFAAKTRIGAACIDPWGIRVQELDDGSVQLEALYTTRRVAERRLRIVFKPEEYGRVVSGQGLVTRLQTLAEGLRNLSYEDRYAAMKVELQALLQDAPSRAFVTLSDLRVSHYQRMARSLLQDFLAQAMPGGKISMQEFRDAFRKRVIEELGADPVSAEYQISKAEWDNIRLTLQYRGLLKSAVIETLKRITGFNLDNMPIEDDEVTYTFDLSEVFDDALDIEVLRDYEEGLIDEVQG